MNNTTFQPSEFYKNLRPENFSDSYEKKQNTLTSELLDFELSKITTNQKHDMFEDLCIEMAGKLICPNLIPQTGPTGGGDGKTDSETYPVSEDISIKWYIPENGWDKDQKWAFAASAKEKWKPKVKDDVKKIVETKRGYTHIYFFTNQTPSSKQKSDTQDELKKNYGIDVTIFDGKWVSKNIFSKNLINLAVKKLNLSDSYKIEQVLGSNDIERKEKLEELEEKISHPDRYIEFDYQIVVDAINAANISRHLELPKLDTVGKYERAKKLNEKFGSIKLDIQISYQLAWTYYMYFNDYQSFATEFLNFSELLKKYHNVDDLEFYSTLIQLLKTLSKQVDLSKALDIDEVEKVYIKALEYFINDTDKNTNHYIAKAHKLIYYITKAISEKEDSIKYLKELKNIINESCNLVRFPFMMFKDQIEVLGQILVNSKEYDELILSVAEIDSIRNSEVSSGIVMLERGMQKIKGESYKDAVIFLGRSIRKLAKEESEYELYYAFISLSISYNALGLKWAHYNSLLSALNIKMQYFFKGGVVNKSIINLLKEIIEFEIIAGRLPSFLTWYELYLILSSQTDCETKEERIKFIQIMDAFVSVMLTNIEFSKLVNATKLASILDELGLEISKDTVLYILGGKELLDEEFIKGVGGESGIKPFFSSVMNQPLKNQFMGEVSLFYKQNSYTLYSNILGTKIKVHFENQDYILYVESFLSFLEGFLAASFDFFPTINHIDIILTFTINEDKQSIKHNLNHHEYNINFNSNFTDINDSFFYALVFILLNSFTGITEDKLEKLFSSDGVFERVSLITSHPNIFKNIIGGDSKFQLEKWEKSLYKDVKVLNIKTPLKGSKVKEIENKDSKERHDNREIQSIINIPLWNNAKWNSFAFVTRNPKKELGLVIFFTNKEYGRKIAEEITLITGKNDLKEIIRLSIIKGVNEENKYHYAVHLCNDIDTAKIKGGLLINVSRYHIMTPDNDVNIKNIELLYKMLGKYTLYFGYTDINTGDKNIFWDLGIEKRKLNIKEAKELGKNDLEIVVLNNEHE